MYAGPRGVKRPLKDRLGPNFPLRSSGAIDQQDLLKRQRQDGVKGSNGLLGERNSVRNDVPKNLTTPIQKDALKSSRNNIDCGTEVQKKALKNGQTPTLVRLADLKGRSSTELMSAKKSAAQSKPTPTSGEKNHIVTEQLTVAAFLQRLGLSKYHITFQAEEVDMFALKHMNDDDLKSIGLPMGPRKKILFALAPAKAKK